MAVLAPVYSRAAPGFVRPTRRLINCQVTRNGEQTPAVKYVRFYRTASDIAPLALMVLQDGYQDEQAFGAAEFDGGWHVQVLDLSEPRTGLMRWPSITQDVTLRFDLTDDTGGGGGDPAQLPAVVRVQGVQQARPVVVVERLLDGTWRVAGAGDSSSAEVQMIDLKVSPASLIYALAVDDWGVVFQPGVPVAAGMTIRPTVFMGWLYRVTQPGNLPSVEPAWWDETLPEPQPLGTARAEVVRYFRPQGLGPLSVEMI